METERSSNPNHKVLVGFKCSPPLKLALCEQAEKIGVTLSSHVEAIVSFYKSEDTEAKIIADKASATATEKRISELTSQLAKERETVAAKEKRLKELDTKLIKEREITKKAVSEFIMEISEGNKRKATKLIETYNKILKDGKSE